jgi:hypothetical protein
VSVAATVAALAAVEWESADEAVVAARLADVRRVRGWLDAVEVAAARRLSQLAAVSPSLFAERIAADAARVSLVEAGRGFERAATTAAIPELGVVLESGAASGGHVDVVTRAMRPLNPDQRQQLAERGQVLAEAAGLLGRDEFARTVRNEIRRIDTSDGVDRLQRQRRNTFLRTWVDRVSGMCCLRGEFDPENGAILLARLQNATDTMFHTGPLPDTCPSDPQAKQQHLQALALIAMTAGDTTSTSAGAPRVDISVLIDADTLLSGEHDQSLVDYGIPVELPVETIRRWACQAEITPIIVAADNTSLWLGRTTRIANKQQRRALHAMYHTCIIDDCDVPFGRCQIHHITWYRNGGGTDIDDLAPVCNGHHHKIHEGGWQLSIDARRNVTITYPDGTSTTSPPPQARAP